MMIAMTERTNVELREAFLELAMGEGYPDPDTLDAFVRLFPDHAEELTNFAIDLVITSRANEDESFVAAEGGALDVEVASALSAFQNALFAARQGEKVSSSVEGATVARIENPFARLDRGGMKAVTTGLHANAVFVGKLRDRIIAAETLTVGFIRRVSELLDSPYELVGAHFRAGQVAAAGQHFKADEKPVIGATETFEEALQTSNLEPDQQAYLRSL